MIQIHSLCRCYERIDNKRRSATKPRSSGELLHAGRGAPRWNLWKRSDLRRHYSVMKRFILFILLLILAAGTIACDPNDYVNQLLHGRPGRPVPVRHPN